MMLTVVVLTGCNMQAPADLLTAPAYGVQDETLAAAIDKSLPAEARLSLPYQGEELNVVHQVDVSGDGKNEAIVTYVNNVGEHKLLLLRQTENQWREWMTLEIPFNDPLDRLEIINLDEDGLPELAVGYYSYQTQGLIFDIYKLSDVDISSKRELPPSPIVSIPYSLAEFGDMNGDGREELVVVSQPEQWQEDISEQQLETAGEQIAQRNASIYRLEQGELRKVAEIELDDDKNYYRMRICKLTEEQSGLLLEANHGLHGISAVVFTWKNEEAMKKIYQDDGYQYMDIEKQFDSELDVDSILQLVELREVPGQDSGAAPMEILYFEELLQWNGKDRFDIVARRYSDYQYGFSYLLPLTWKDQVTVNRPEAKTEGTGIIAFEQYDEKGQRPVLFTIHAVPYSEWPETKKRWQEKVRYVKLRTASGFVYSAVYGKAPDDMSSEEKERFQEMQPAPEELKKHFTVIAPN